jgi:hypothetical protein
MQPFFRSLIQLKTEFAHQRQNAPSMLALCSSPRGEDTGEGDSNPIQPAQPSRQAPTKPNRFTHS